MPENQNITPYSELLSRFTSLEKENQDLQAENERLRKLLGIEIIEKQEVTEEQPTATINKYSSPDDKISLFMSLFRGRNDVFAKRCYIRKYDNAYYMPACKNEWVRGVCDKQKVKCKNCKNREFLPLTKEVINSQLRHCRREHNALAIKRIGGRVGRENRKRLLRVPKFFVLSHLKNLLI